MNITEQEGNSCMNQEKIKTIDKMKKSFKTMECSNFNIPSAEIVYGFDFIKRFNFLEFTMKYGASFENIETFYKK